MFCLERNHVGFFICVAFSLCFFDESQHFFISRRDDAGDAALGVFPVFQETAAQFAAGVLDMAGEHVLDDGDFAFIGEISQMHQVLVAVCRFQVVYVSDTTGHAGGKVPPCTAQYEDAVAGHVFTAMIAYAFDDSRNAAVADAEPFTGDAVDIGFATGRAIESYVADDDVVFCREYRFYWWMDDNLAT